MKKITILLAAAMCVSAAVAQDAPKYINSLSINYNNNTLYPKDADHLTLNGFGVNYNFDYRLSESVPVYLGTGVNLQFLFRSENLLDDDIIGELPSMRNLDITDTRAKLHVYAKTGLLTGGEGSVVPMLTGSKK